MRQIFIVFCTAAAVLAGLGHLPATDAIAGDGRKPQRVGSYSQLRSLIQAHQPRYFAGYRTGLGAVALNAPASAPSGATSFSTTPTQVAGVDEGDKVKNNDTIICQINQGRVLILGASPDSHADVLGALDFTNEGFYPQELYLEHNQLIVVGTAFRTPSGDGGSLRPIWYFSTGTVQAKIYDLADPAHPSKQREVEVAGDYVATRKIGSCLYLVARQYPDYYAQAAPVAALRSDSRRAAPATRTMIPTYRDSKLGKKARSLSLKRCYYFPGFDDPVYLVVGGLDLANPHSLLDVNAFLGAGEQVYSSLENLYVTASRPADLFFAGRLNLAASPAVSGGAGSGVAAGHTASGVVVDPSPPVPIPDFSERTDIYKILLSKGHSEFLAANTVTGSVLNAYSMDEHDGYFRVATTEHSWWSLDQQEHNHLFVFDASLALNGSLDDFAPGERIYAVRFLGNRAFMVTFQQIDPLFAIDLGDPAHPAVVGQLTLPGYTTFLLPYDENHLIGLGKDVQSYNSSGGENGDVPWWTGQVFYQGVKLALFDVTDLRHPIETSSVSIGDRGTDSPALSDPHAVLFDSARNLLAFPISVAHVAAPDPAQPWQWGDTVFQGAYVYQVSPDSGLVFRGSITHKPSGQEPNMTWGDEIDRVITIGSNIYTLSDARLKANDAQSLEEKASLTLPQPPPQPDPIIYLAGPRH